MLRSPTKTPTRPAYPIQGTLFAMTLLLLILVAGTKIAVGATEYTAVDVHPSGYLWSYGFAGAVGQQAGIGGYPSLVGPPSSHALLWGGSGCVDLNGACTESAACGTDGTQQAGWGTKVWGKGTESTSHALLWSGAANDFVDLNPAGFDNSLAYGVCDRQQVGYGVSASDGKNHALLWNGTAESCVDLSSDCIAVSTNGSLQVGYSSVAGTTCAMKWSWDGKNTNAESLNWASYAVNSEACYVSGDQIVGWGQREQGAAQHATLWWLGESRTPIDLNPEGFASSIAYGTDGLQQVGCAWKDGESHAMLWNASSTDYVDLSQFLDPDVYYDACAKSIDSQGNILGYAKKYYNGPGTGSAVHALVWQPIPAPEPSTLLMLLAVLVCVGGYTWQWRNNGS